MSTTERLVSIREVATRLGVSPRTVGNMVSRREIEHVKVGRLVRIPEGEVERYIDEHKRRRVS